MKKRKERLRIRVLRRDRMLRSEYMDTEVVRDGDGVFLTGSVSYRGKFYLIHSLGRKTVGEDNSFFIQTSYFTPNEIHKALHLNEA